MPIAGIFLGPPKLIRHACTAHNGQTLIHQQQFAVIAVQVVHAPAPTQTVVKPQLNPGVDQTASQTHAQGKTAIAIKQATHTHVTLSRQHQRIHHRFGTGPGFNQIQLKINVITRLGNGRQHPGEKLRTINQQFKLIGAAPREHCASHISGP